MEWEFIAPMIMKSTLKLTTFSNHKGTLGDGSLRYTGG